jgi:glycosyltransferase involved in cell wall biosynthesis
MKIAIVHDHLLEFGGAERVFVALHKAFPEADLFTSYLNLNGLGNHRKNIEALKIHTSWANYVPGMKRLHSPLRFLYPYIWESLDLSAYDVVISSSATAMCRGVITRPETLHITYMHHPPRYLYNYETAMEWKKHVAIRIYATLINYQLRAWDYLSAQRPDFIISNSEETKKRVSKFYRRDSDVIYPPVTIPQSYEKTVGEYYLTVSRLARAKHIDVLIRAANLRKLPLVVVGSGRDETYLKRLSGPTIRFASDVPDHQLQSYYKGAKAFLFASQDEEFGIAPVEAMGYGLPVIAYRSGGLKETVQHGQNGFLYPDLTPDSLAATLDTFEQMSSRDQEKMGERARKASQQYSLEQFVSHMQKYVETKMKNMKDSA